MLCHILQMFDMLDVDDNGHIEFGEVVSSVFHPKTPEQSKLHVRNLCLGCNTDFYIGHFFCCSFRVGVF